MEILKNFGFDLPMVVAQIINFLIIFYVLKRFLYKPVMSMVKTREEKIALGLKQAEEARLKLEQTLEEEKKILGKAQTEAKELIEEAKTQALSLAASIEVSAKAQSEKMLLDARAQMAQDATEIEKGISAKIGTLASEMLAKSLKGIFTEKDQKVIITKALKGIKRID